MSSSATATKYDVFLSFRGPDTRRNFISFLYKELVGRDIRTFKDEEELENGQRISPELKRAIEESRFAVVVVSVNYAASPWCLEELVKIMDLEKKRSITVMPIFYGVDPCHVRRQIGEVAEQFKKHEDREEDHEKVLSWKRALTDLASISGNCSLKWEDDSKLVDEIADKISKKLNIVTTRSNGRNLVGIYTHMKALNRLLDLNSNKSVRVVGIWAIGYNGRSALAKFVYQNICQHFESHCFLGSVKRISQGRHLSHLHEEFLERIQGEYSSKQSLKNQKVLLVADDVNELEQLDALADDFNCFGPGSVVIITTQDKLLLISSGIKLVYEVELLKFQKVYEVRQLFRSDAFKQRDDPVGFEQSTYRAMNISGSPSLTTWNYSMHPSLESMANMIPPEHCGVRSYGCTDDPHPLAGSPSLTTWSFSMHRSLESMANMIPPEHCGVRSYGCTDDPHPLAGSPSLTTWSYSMHPSLESMANTISPDHCGVRSYGCIDDPHPSPKYTHSHDGVQWTIVSKSLLKTILLFGFISFGFYK